MIIKNLTKSYNDKLALNNINFTIKKNQCNYIIGRNGAGKTTLIKSILEIIKFDSGEIIFDEGLKVSDISYLNEERGLYSNISVYEQIKYFADLRNIKNVDEKVTKLIEEFDLTKYKNFKISELSKGNSQKVQLCCIFVTESKFVILDEPFSGLDPLNSIRTMETIIKLAKNKILLISTHQMEFINEFAENILILSDGDSIFSGSIDDFINNNAEKKLTLKNNVDVIETLVANNLNFEENKNKIILSNKEDIKKLLSLDQVLNFEFSFEYPQLSKVIVKELVRYENERKTNNKI